MKNTKNFDSMQKTESLKIDLVRIARNAMFAKGLHPDVPVKAKEQLDQILSPASCAGSADIIDMTHKLWFSIDNDDSKDLDQLTYAEHLNDKIVRIYVAIADVDVLVKKDSPIDSHALENTTSVYTPMIIFPMLPEKLSTNFTSLNPDEKRIAMIVQMDVNEEGKVTSSTLYRGCVFNYAKLAYNGVGAWLENQGQPPEPIRRVKDLDAQIRLQDEIAQRLKKYRHASGALTFETYDPQPVIKNGQVVDIQDVKINRARELIENFMIAANTAVTNFQENKNLPTIKRVVRTPKRWDRIVTIASEYNVKLPSQPDSKALEAFLIARRAADPLRFPDLSLVIIKLLGRGEYVVELPNSQPLGHFALALTNYTHSTAPNRRYPDLVVQRMLKSYLSNQQEPYSLSILQKMMEECTDKETRAEKVKRSVMKSVIAIYLQDSIGKKFDAFVTGAGIKGTWVRLISTAIEGKLVAGYEKVDVGDKISVILQSVDIEKGHLNFVKASS